MPSAEPTIPCPHCRQAILAVAQKCKFCKHWVANPPASAAGSGDPFSSLLEPSPQDEVRGAYATCPWCKCPGQAERVSFTWWGGLVGPAMFCHVKCRRCRKCYNGRTGNRNDTAITIYLAVTFGIALVLGLLMCLAGNL